MKRLIIVGVVISLVALAVFFSKRMTHPHEIKPIEIEKVKVSPKKAKDILALVKASPAKVKIINVWAAWCAPCLIEFPHFADLYRDMKDDGVELMFVSADFPSELGAVRSFLAKMGVEFQTYIKDEEDETFINTFHSKWSGALPTTFIYDEAGELKHFLSQPLEEWELEQKVLSVLENSEETEGKENE